MRITDAETAISEGVSDGDDVYIAGFGHLSPYSLSHEVIRQGLSDLTVTRPNLTSLFDQLIGAGCVEHARFSWTGGSCFRRAVTEGVPREIEFTEYPHHGTVARIHAGARNLPFLPMRAFAGSDIVDVNDEIRFVDSPYGDETLPTLPPLRPDVTLLHAHRADRDGNLQIVGLESDVRDAAYAADTVIASVETVVDPATIRRDPNLPFVPKTVVDYVVEEPFGAHPAYAQGLYAFDRGITEWAEIVDTQEGVEEWLDEWVYGVADRSEYLEKIGASHLADLQQAARAFDMGGDPR